MIWHQIVVSIWNFGGVPFVFSGEVLGIANVERPALTDVAYEPSSSELDVEQPKECHGGTTRGIPSLLILIYLIPNGTDSIPCLLFSLAFA